VTEVKAAMAVQSSILSLSLHDLLRETFAFTFTAIVYFAIYNFQNRAVTLCNVLSIDIK
jgi:hypothetical protein